MIMTWQDWAVVIIAVLVGIALIHRIWRFFTCSDASACSSCNKECNRRK